MKVLLTLSLIGLALGAPTGSRRSENSGSTPGALYFTTNDRNGNSVVAVGVNSDGTFSGESQHNMPPEGTGTIVSVLSLTHLEAEMLSLVNSRLHDREIFWLT